MSFPKTESITRLGNIAYSDITYDEQCLLSDAAYRALADLNYDTKTATLMKIINYGNGVYSASFTLLNERRINISFNIGTELYKINNSLKTKSKPYASIW